MEQNLYDVLGVGEHAAPAEIKKAYRDLARRYHPDRNPGDDAAEARFKEAAEAYRVLGDADLRQQYDDYRGSERRTWTAAPPQNTGEMFTDGLGGTRPGSKPRSVRGDDWLPLEKDGAPGSDLKYRLEVRLEEAALGASRTIHLPRARRCRRCAGTGAELGTALRVCPSCGGCGSVKVEDGFFDRTETCPPCRGEGRVVSKACRDCRGAGRETVDVGLTVEVPGGVRTGTRLRLAKEGQPGINGRSSGDLYVVIEVLPHPFFVREDDDIFVEVPVRMTEAALGGQIEIPTLEGRMRMRIPPGSQSGRVFRLKGRGVTSLNGSHRGDQRVRIRVETPENLSGPQRSLLETFAQAEASRESPAWAAFRKCLDAYYRD